MIARRALSDKLGASERKIRTALELLSKEQILTIKTTNTHSIIKLTNWAFLQDSQEQTTHETTSTRPALDQHSTQEQERENERKIDSNKDTRAKPKRVTHPDQDEVWASLKAAWSTRYPGQPEMTWPTMRDFSGHLFREINRLTKAELLRRWVVFLNGTFPDKNIRSFITRTDSFIEAQNGNTFPRGTGFRGASSQGRPAGSGGGVSTGASQSDAPSPVYARLLESKKNGDS